MNEFKHELIVCIVNEGFSDAVMDAAKEVGATGGTVIDARGTASKEAEKLFSIVVQPQKEVVMIVVPSEIRDSVLHALYKEVGLNTAGQGIAFSLPVDNVVGIRTEAPKTENAESDSDAENGAENAETENAAKSAAAAQSENSADKGKKKLFRKKK